MKNLFDQVEQFTSCMSIFFFVVLFVYSRERNQLFIHLYHPYFSCDNYFCAQMQIKYASVFFLFLTRPTNCSSLCELVKQDEE